MRYMMFFTTILSIVSLTTLGQEVQTTRSNNHQHAVNQTPDDLIRIHTNRLTNDLQLNENQAKQLYDFNTNSYNNHQVLIQNQVSGAERSQIERSNQELYDRQIRGVLTEDQYNVYYSRRDDYRMEWNAGEVDLPTQDLRNARKPVSQPGDLPADPGTQPGLVSPERPATQPQHPNVPQPPTPPTAPQ